MKSWVAGKQKPAVECRDREVAIYLDYGNAELFRVETPNAHVICNALSKYYYRERDVVQLEDIWDDGAAVDWAIMSSYYAADEALLGWMIRERCNSCGNFWLAVMFRRRAVREMSPAMYHIWRALMEVPHGGRSPVRERREKGDYVRLYGRKLVYHSFGYKVWTVESARAEELFELAAKYNERVDGNEVRVERGARTLGALLISAYYKLDQIADILMKDGTPYHFRYIVSDLLDGMRVNVRRTQKAAKHIYWYLVAHYRLAYDLPHKLPYKTPEIGAQPL